MQNARPILPAALDKPPLSLPENAYARDEIHSATIHEVSGSTGAILSAPTPEYLPEQREADIRTIRDWKGIIVLNGLSGAGKTMMRKMLGSIMIDGEPMGKIVTTLTTRPLRIDEKTPDNNPLQIQGINVFETLTNKQLDEIKDQQGVIVETYPAGTNCFDFRGKLGHSTLFFDSGDIGALAAGTNFQGTSVIQIWLSAQLETMIERGITAGKSSNTMIHRLNAAELEKYIPVTQIVGQEGMINAEQVPEKVLDEILRVVALKIRKAQ